MNLHVFNDAHGFVLNVTIERFAQANALQKNCFINLNQKTIYKNEKVVYLKKNILAYRKAARELSSIQSVTFYPFDDSAAWFLRELKRYQPSFEVKWVFWSYEFYYRPDRYAALLGKFSSQYYKRHQTYLKKIRNAITLIAKKVLRIPFFDLGLLKSGYQQVHVFYSFLPEDYRNVYAEINNNQCSFRQISFLSIDQITHDLLPAPLSHKIMIGHSAVPTANHAEMLEQLSKKQIFNKLFIPLEYGEKQYKNEIKLLAKNLFNDRIEVLENRLSMHEYYQKLSDIGYALFAFYKQEALGNILFLVWNGAKVFLCEESSVYRQFKIWGLTVFSISQDFTKDQFQHLLSPEESAKNKRIIEALFSEQQLKTYWEALMD